jgi:hypothetical protein
MLKYFDLNERSKRAFTREGCSADDGAADPGCPEDATNGCPPGSKPAVKELSVTDQLIMYFGVLIGVLFSSYVRAMADGGTINFAFTTSITIVSVIVALAIIPIVYEKLKIDPAAPFIVQFGIFVQSGVFWHMIISSIGKIL